MRRASRPKTLTDTITAHVTAEEEQRMKDRAATLGLTKSEWCRHALLDALNVGPETQLLLAELMAFRKIFLTIHTEILHGHEPDAQTLKAIVDEAETTKQAMANQRIQKFYAGESAA